MNKANDFYNSETWASMSDSEKERVRLHRLLKILFYICDLAGFHIEERIVLRDKYSGNVWR